ncbi:MAG: hypothetical protein IPK60_12820 [Sandaracinaceae bacterium]|nr:hypothetical protein [Sandaracinaceae bacterium]
MQAATPDTRDTLTHGFHSYPARMHPEIARLIIPELTRRGEIVVDPFCGSGTVLVEARVASRQGFGVDLNPLGLRLAEVKARSMDEEARERFSILLHEIGERSEERVRSRAESRAPLHKSEVHWYDGHVLRELAGLWEEIHAVQDESDRFALELILTAIVVKVSRQESDTREEAVTKRIRKGLPTEFFVRKGEELIERWADLFEELDEDSPPPRLFVGDARELSSVLPRGVKADLILTSPPYGGTYDYYDHHARRLAWLRLDARRLREHEIGARRNTQSKKSGIARWESELNATLASMAESLKPGCAAVLLIGDADIAGERIDADEQVKRLALANGFEPVAIASQPRPDWLGGPPRREHLLMIRRRLR